MQSQKPPRPIGVTIISVLALIVGVIGLIAGVALLGFTALFATSEIPLLSGILAGLTLIIAGTALFFAFIWLLVGWGFLNGKGWAWIIGLIFSFLTLLGTLLIASTGSIGGIVGVVILSLIIYYLFTSPVKAFFGKGSTTSQSFSKPPPTGRSSFSPASIMANPSSSSTSYSSSSSTSYGSRSSTGTRFCTNCGATLNPGANKCSSCGANI